MSTVRYSEFGVEKYNYEKQEWEPIASAYEWVNKRTRPAKPNNKTMKYRVTTELLYHYDLGDEIEKYERDKLVIGEGCPESWFEPVEEIEVGDWIIGGSGTPLYVNKVLDEYYSYTRYRDGADPITDGRLEKKNLERKATTDEIEQALKEEAKRRGLAPGNKVKTPCGFEYTLSGNPYEYKYKADLDRLYSSGVLIYDNGDFAEPIDQTPAIEINGNKVEFNDHPKVGCTTIKKKVFIEQAKTIARHGIRIHRKGEDITDQILAIASHYGYETDLSNTVGETVTIEGSFDGSITWGFSSDNMWSNND